MRARTPHPILITCALAAWTAIGVGAALHDGAYGTLELQLVTVGVCALVVGAIFVTRQPRFAPQLIWLAEATALGVAIYAAWTQPAGKFGSGGWLVASHDLTLAATGLAALWFLARLPRAWLGAAAVVALQTVGGVAMIRSSPRPLIDDWFMLQAATRGMSHGQNIYTVAWSGPPHEATNLFAYLPGSAVLVWPFHVLFGDVRYGILAGLVATCAVLIWVNRSSPAALLGCLPLLYPKVLFGLEQSWIDPLVLLGVCAAAIVVTRGRPGWGIVFLAAALACKQQAWVILPLTLTWRGFGWRRALAAGGLAAAFTLPWAVADRHAFVFDVLQYQLRLPPRIDSLSLYPPALVHNAHPVLAWLVLGTLCALALAAWRMPRGAAGFLFGSALAMAAFNLFNKQTFFNEWELAAGLAGAAAVVAIREKTLPAATPVRAPELAEPRVPETYASTAPSRIMEEPCH